MKTTSEMWGFSRSRYRKNVFD